MPKELTQRPIDIAREARNLERTRTQNHKKKPTKLVRTTRKGYKPRKSSKTKKDVPEPVQVVIKHDWHKKATDQKNMKEEQDSIQREHKRHGKTETKQKTAKTREKL